MIIISAFIKYTIGSFTHLHIIDMTEKTTTTKKNNQLVLLCYSVSSLVYTEDMK